MSDPLYRDPNQPPREDEARSRRVTQLNYSSNAMWGWIAGGVLVALVLIFVFARSDTANERTASETVSPPAATTGAAPPRSPPATTGQGATRPANPPAATPPANPPAQNGTR